MVDEQSDEKKIQFAKTLEGFTGDDLKSHLNFILQGRDNWLKTCILYYAGLYACPGFEKPAKVLEASKEMMLKETAAFYLTKLQRSSD